MNILFLWTISNSVYFRRKLTKDLWTLWYKNFGPLTSLNIILSTFILSTCILSTFLPLWISYYQHSVRACRRETSRPFCFSSPTCSQLPAWSDETWERKCVSRTVFFRVVQGPGIIGQVLLLSRRKPIICSLSRETFFASELNNPTLYRAGRLASLETGQ